jgi:hypothetical protein
MKLKPLEPFPFEKTMKVPAGETKYMTIIITVTPHATVVCV